MRRAGLVVLVALVLGGCSEGDPGADGDVESLGALVPSPLAEELTESGRCPDGRLWAADDRGTLAVVVDVSGTPADEVVLPSEDVEVTVLHDEGPCAPDDEGAPGTQGRVEVDRDAEGCVTGFRIDGLEGDDGTTFGPIEGSTPC